jgi:hypothetical protein
VQWHDNPPSIIRPLHFWVRLPTEKAQFTIALSATIETTHYRTAIAHRHVRFGSKADICSAQAHVRFTPESGHLQCNSACLLAPRLVPALFARSLCAPALLGDRATSLNPSIGESDGQRMSVFGASQAITLMTQLHGMSYALVSA